MTNEETLRLIAHIELEALRGATHMTDEHVAEIVEAVGRTFRTFGGGRDSDTNPMAHALKDQPLQFAAGVDVANVVRFIIELLPRAIPVIVNENADRPPHVAPQALPRGPA